MADCLADAYLELGHLDEAIAEYQRILRRNPKYPLAQYHLGQAYERQGQPERARAAYERFLHIWKDADPDIPEVIDAKHRLTKLSYIPKSRIDFSLSSRCPLVSGTG